MEGVINEEWREELGNKREAMINGRSDKWRKSRERGWGMLELVHSWTWCITMLVLCRWNASWMLLRR